MPWEDVSLRLKYCENSLLRRGKMNGFSKTNFVLYDIYFVYYNPCRILRYQKTLVTNYNNGIMLLILANILCSGFVWR